MQIVHLVFYLVATEPVARLLNFCMQLARHNATGMGLASCFEHVLNRLVEKQLAGKSYLFGEAFTVADAYLFTVTSWAHYVKLDLSAFPNVLAFQKRVAARPKVKEAMQAEGLLPKEQPST